METYNTSLVEIHQPSLMKEAKASLSGRWGLAVPAYLVFILVSGFLGLIPILPLILSGPFSLGVAMFCLRLARDEHAEIGNIFDGFKNFGTALAAYIVMMILVALGFLFFIVPGIILALGLSQTFYIIADNPEVEPIEALKQSWEMMKGHKMDFFILGLRFIPWLLLCLLTLGIGIFWLAPYAGVTFAKFYDRLSGGIASIDGSEDIERHLVD